MERKINIKIEKKAGSFEIQKVNPGVLVKDILEYDKETMGVRVNNEIRTMNHQLVDDCVLSEVKYSDYDGYRIYTRTCRFILYMALKRCYPDMKIELCNSIANASYFLTDVPFSDTMAEKIYKEMKIIVSNASSCVRRILTNEEAHALYASINANDKLKELSTRLATYMTIYFCEDIFNSMNGVLADNTSKIVNFNVSKFRKGFALIYPDAKDISKCAKYATESKLHAIYEENDKYLELFNIRNVSDLNRSIINGQLEEIVKISETVHENKLEELTNNIVNRKTVKLILVAGPSSSGKTTFAGELGLHLKLRGYNAIKVSMDNYFKERVDTPRQPNGEYDFETIDALDIPLLNNHMSRLLNGEEVEMPEFNFIDGVKEYNGNKVKMQSNDVIVMEGIHAFNEAVSTFAKQQEKYKIYIAPMTTLNIDELSKVSTTDTRMLRRMVRDFETRGHDVEKTLSMWSNIMIGEEKYIYPYIEEADGIFNTSLVYEMAVLKQKAEPLLLKIPVTSKYFSETRRLFAFLSNFLGVDTKVVPDSSILREFIGRY